jgi:hypothetical protein
VCFIGSNWYYLLVAICQPIAPDVHVFININKLVFSTDSAKWVLFLIW